MLGKEVGVGEIFKDPKAYLELGPSGKGAEKLIGPGRAPPDIILVIKDGDPAEKRLS